MAGVSNKPEQTAAGSDFDEKVVATGLRLYSLIEGETPSIFRKNYWTGKVMDWSMQDEAFKVEMFRFVDVFPSLKTAESVATHLREYFGRPEQDFPDALQWGIKAVSPDSFAAKMIAKGIAKNIEAMGSQFILGATAEEALPVLRKLRADGLALTIDLLGEAVVSEREAEEYSRRYLELLETLDREQRHWKALQSESDLDWGSSPKVNVSIKASAMYSQMKARAFEDSVQQAKERLRPIFRRAKAMGASVYLDMEHLGLKNLTLALYRSIMEEPEFRGYPHSGIAIQAYLRDSEQDVRDLLAWCRAHEQRITIRLVKGAYWDDEVMQARQHNWPIPVYTDKNATDANFEKVALLILENHEHFGLACASHNIRSIAFVLKAAEQLGVQPDRLEFQVLYGMAEPVRNALRKAGLRLRLYAPVGEMIPGMAYLVRRLLENTSNESFLRLSFNQGVSKEELLKNPSLLAVNDGLPHHSEGATQTTSSSFQNLPPLDWTIEEHREYFAKALQAVRRRFPIEAPLAIGSEQVSTASKIESTNPNNPAEIVGVASAAGKADAQRAIHAAREALAQWRDTSPAVRAEYLFRAAEIARGRRYDLAALQVFEAGKGWSETDADVCEAIDFLEYYGREMNRLARPQKMGNAPGESSLLFYEPRGVTAVIAPWNFPLAISTGMTAAAIVTGNTVVYKPSSETPIIGRMLYELFRDAGLPPGVLNYLPGPGREVGDLLVTHPDIALIAFTGSREVGLRMLRLAAETPEGAVEVKRVIAEMGGKNAIIVDTDANLDEAVEAVLHSAFGYQGQKCSACSRLILLDEIHDRFVERLRAAAESIYLGPAEDPRSEMGAVISAGARKKIDEYVEIGKQEGTLVLERQWDHGTGHFVPLTIVKDIRPEHRLAQEEIFGPVLAVMRAKTFDEALTVANGTPYALTGGVLSRSPENIDKARRRFRVGNLYINRGCTGAIVNRHPFGGFKMSGVGSKAGGPDYLQQFMVPRNIVENTIRRGFAPMETAD